MRYDVTGDGWGNNEMSRLARDASKRLKQGDSSLVLPVVAYYGTAVFFWGGAVGQRPRRVVTIVFPEPGEIQKSRPEGRLRL